MIYQRIEDSNIKKIILMLLIFVISIYTIGCNKSTNLEKNKSNIIEVIKQETKK